MPADPVRASPCRSLARGRLAGMRLLFLGGTGLISSACAELALHRGHDLTLIVRGQSRKHQAPDGARVIHHDMQESASSDLSLLEETQFDAVVDFIAYTPADVSRHVELVEGRAQQYVLISSASVYRKPPLPYLVREDHALGNEFWEYARDKIAAEERAWQLQDSGGLPVTVVRPSLTYGPSQIPLSVGSWLHPWTVIHRALQGSPLIVPGDGTSLWCLTWNADFASGLLGLLGNRAAVGKTFHITSDEVLTWNQIFLEVFAALDMSPRILHVATDIIADYWPQATGTLLGDKIHSMVFDNSRVKSIVPDFQCEVPWAEGLRRALEWHRAHPEFQTVDHEFEQVMVEIVAASHRSRPAYPDSA